MARVFVGIDWASRKHDVCVLGPAGEVLSCFVIAHSAEGLKELTTRLLRFALAAEIQVALERPSGLLVDTLVEAGVRVVPIHPNALKASRPHYSAAQAKSDAGDAYILADLMRTDGHRFRPLRAPSDQTKALRAAVRTREDLVATRVCLANQLRSLLESFWPGAAVIFADIDSPIALSFLESFPSPESAAHLGERRMERFLKRHAYSGRRSPAALLERLRAAPKGHAGALESEAKAQLVRSLVSVLRPLVAQILAELGDDRERFATHEQLSAEAGVAPVTHASGKHRAVTCRFACNKRLRRALTTWADNSRHQSPWAASVYRQARARGCDHPHAVRILARAWTRVLYRCWKDKTPYDPQRHGRALPFLGPQQPSAQAA